SQPPTTKPVMFIKAPSAPQATEPPAGKTDGQTPDRGRPEPRENFLQSRLEYTILEAIRNASDKGITDAALDYIFGKQVLSPQREKIFSRFQILNLVRCEKTPGGGRIWFPVLRRGPAKNETIKPKQDSITDLKSNDEKEHEGDPHE